MPNIIPYQAAGVPMPYSQQQKGVVPYQPQPFQSGPFKYQGDGKVKPKAKGLGLFGLGFTAVDATMRIHDGENPVAAIGKAVATNAIFAAMPMPIAIPVGIGLVAATMTPELIAAGDAMRAGLASKKTAFSSGYTENEATGAMRSQGMENLMQARSHASSRIANHARSARKVY